MNPLLKISAAALATAVLASCVTAPSKDSSTETSTAPAATDAVEVAAVKEGTSPPLAMCTNISSPMG